MHLHVSELPVLVTGAGKVNAALAVATILSQFSPASVVGLGTAGALKDDMSGTHVIGTVIQHDFAERALYELSGIHFGGPISLGNAGPVLATGDAFIDDADTRAQLALHADLVDMEGYAVAAAAANAGVRVTLVKRVSDAASDGALLSWKETIDDCAVHLGEWVRANLLN